MNFQVSNDVNINGTSLVGQIDCGYDHLVRVLGAPNRDGDGYKVDAEWTLRFDDGTIATIYNWKDGRNYLGAHGARVETIRDWHVGGKTDRALYLVAGLLGIPHDRITR